MSEWLACVLACVMAVLFCCLWVVLCVGTGGHKVPTSFSRKVKQ